MRSASFHTVLPLMFAVLTTVVGLCSLANVAQAAPCDVEGVATQCWTVSVTPALLSAADVNVMATVTVGSSAPVVVPAGASAEVNGVPAGVVEVIASAPGFESVVATVSLSRDEALRPALWPAGTVVVSGEVLDGFGQPASGVGVALRSLPPRDSGAVFQAVTAGDGSFRIAGVPASDVELTLTAAGADTLVIGPQRVLSDTSLVMAMVPSDEEATLRSLGRSCAMSGGGSVASLVAGAWWMFALFGLRRRWR